MDLEFAEAIRHAAAHPLEMAKEARSIEERVRRAEPERLADSALVARRTLAAKTAGAAQETNDQLNIATAHFELDQDEVDDARDDLTHAWR